MSHILQLLRPAHMAATGANGRIASLRMMSTLGDFEARGSGSQKAILIAVRRISPHALLRVRALLIKVETASALPSFSLLCPLLFPGSHKSLNPRTSCGLRGTRPSTPDPPVPRRPSSRLLPRRRRRARASTSTTRSSRLPRESVSPPPSPAEAPHRGS